MWQLNEINRCKLSWFYLQHQHFINNNNMYKYIQWASASWLAYFEAYIRLVVMKEWSENFKMTMFFDMFLFYVTSRHVRFDFYAHRMDACMGEMNLILKHTFYWTIWLVYVLYVQCESNSHIWNMNKTSQFYGSLQDHKNSIRLNNEHKTYATLFDNHLQW